jgi:2-polyprenyl-3-methyl-5-hydroxy-6-metoxy-1,4-benzoquinol methylase
LFTVNVAIILLHVCNRTGIPENDKGQILIKKLNSSLTFDNELFPIVDLGLHPFADWFIPKNALGMAEPVFPLIVCLDIKSGLIHTQFLSDPSRRYNEVEYSYTSSNSLSAQMHWLEYGNFLSNRFPQKRVRAFEIGSNDGFLCSVLNSKGISTIGIDASKAMVDLANEKGCFSIHSLLTIDSADQIQSEFGPAEMVIANNVLNHANDPKSFLLAMSRLMTHDGLMFIEVPYWKYQFENYNFDMIYHEHVSYFTLTSMFNILKTLQLSIVDFALVPYHGQSIRLVVGSSKYYSSSSKLMAHIELEKKIGLFRPESYSKYIKKINLERSRILDKLFYEASQGFPIVGIGAAAKGNTLLNYYGLNSSNVKAITDNSPRKIGKFTPLSRIEIFPDEYIAELENPIVFMLSWNISNQLQKKIKSINSNVRFLK